MLTSNPCGVSESFGQARIGFPKLTLDKSHAARDVLARFNCRQAVHCAEKCLANQGEAHRKQATRLLGGGWHEQPCGTHKIGSDSQVCHQGEHSKNWCDKRHAKLWVVACIGPVMLHPSHVKACWPTRLNFDWFTLEFSKNPFFDISWTKMLDFLLNTRNSGFC